MSVEETRADGEYDEFITVDADGNVEVDLSAVEDTGGDGAPDNQQN